MSITSTQKKEANVVELEIAVSAEQLREAVDKVYKNKVKSINVPGFRKGKAPKSIIERMYGVEVFLEDAIQELYPKAYSEAIEQSDIEPVDRADIEILSVDRENGFTFKATVTVKPEIEVGEYKGIAVTKNISKVQDSEVEAEVEKMRERAARIISVEGRPAKDGDTVTIDFEGFVDGVAFEGGKAQGHKLELGSNSFIPGFEDQVAGYSIGEEFDVNVTFPEEYHSEDLKGKPAVFKIKLHEIKEKQLPDIDDEFAKDVSEFDTIDQMRADIRDKMQVSKDLRSSGEMETRIADVITENISGDIPQVMFENKISDMTQEFAYRLQSQGMNLENYFQYTGMDMQAFRDGFKEQAERHVKMRLALEAIAVKEALAATDDEVEAEYAKLTESYGVDLENIKAAISEKDVKGDVACNKALDLIRENAVITEEEEPAGEEKAKVEKKSPVPKKKAATPKTTKAKEDKAETTEEAKSEPKAKSKPKSEPKEETEDKPKPKAKSKAKAEDSQ